MPSTISQDGTRIAFETLGKGPSLLLVDGAMCYRQSGPMRHLAAKLSDNFAVTIYDRRGRGDSTDTPPYAPEREVEDTAAIIEQIGEPVMLYGCSSGGALALMAADALKSVSKVVVYEIPMIVDDSHRPLTDDILERIRNAIDNGRGEAAIKEFLKFVDVPSWVVFMMKFVGGAWRKTLGVAHTLPYDFSFVAPLQRGASLPRDLWHSANIPVLVLDGGKSPSWMRNAQAQLASILSNASYQTIPGQTHIVVAKAQAPFIRSFLSNA